MKSITRGTLLGLSLTAALAVLAAGCGGGGSGNSRAEGAEKKDAQKDKDEKKPGHEEWCDEHGIPEAECILCNAKLKAEAKANGDWCKHNRAKSQCFACNPKLKELYAAKYRAMFPGKEPPPATEND